MNSLTMQWKSTFRPSVLEQMSDAHMNLLANRFQANRIIKLMGITFAEYLESPAQYDRIAAHLEAGGGCRVVAGQLVINKAEGGICAWCERWWSARSGGLNSNDLCLECAHRFIGQQTRDTHHV